MPFRAKDVIPQRGYGNARSAGISLQNRADDRITVWSAGGTDSEDLRRFIKDLVAYRSEFAAAVLVNGINQYARDQESQPSYNFVNETNALIVEVDALMALLIALIPVDGGGFELLYTRDAAGVETPRTFSAGSMTAIITQLGVVSAEVI